MKLRHFFILAVVIFAGWFAIQWSEPNKGPHNGTIKATSGFYIEAMHDDKEIVVFLLDSAVNTLPNAGMSCTATFEFPDKTVGNLELTPYGSQAFHAPVIDRPYHTCTFTFERSGHKISAEFESEDPVVITNIQ